MATTIFTSCEDEILPIDNGQTDNYDVYRFSKSLSYNSTNPNEQSAFCARSQQTVAASSGDADICAGWQNQYGYFLCSPNASLLKDCYDANGKNYSNPNRTKIKSLGSADIEDYSDVNSLENLYVSSENIDGKSSLGNGVNQLSVGQVIAFETGDGCKGVAQVSNHSKVSKTITITGYVAVPKNSAK